MTKPRIERVPGDYSPRYPEELSRDQYDELIAPDQKGRILAAATAASVSLGASLAAQGDGRPVPAGRRAEAVLEVLSKATAGHSSWFEHSTFERHQDAQGYPVVIPQIPICFGNSQNGVFDGERARKLVRELFVAYGLKPEADHEIAADGVAATIDVYEPALQIGAKLNGIQSEKPRMFGGAEPEPAASALDEEEHKALADKGHRIHNADLNWYPLMDGDQMTPTLAYLASIVAFLNEVTGGPDVDLDAILAKDTVRTALPAPKPAAGVLVEPGEGSMTLTTTAAADVTFEIGRGAEYERRIPPAQRFAPAQWQALDKQPAEGGVALLQIPVYPPAPMTIEQPGGRGVHIEAAGGGAFVPARFDPRRPFRITLKLEAGKRYQLPAFATILGK